MTIHNSCVLAVPKTKCNTAQKASSAGKVTPAGEGKETPPHLKHNFLGVEVKDLQCCDLNYISALWLFRKSRFRAQNSADDVLSPSSRNAGKHCNQMKPLLLTHNDRHTVWADNPNDNQAEITWRSQLISHSVKATWQFPCQPSKCRHIHTQTCSHLTAKWTTPTKGVIMIDHYSYPTRYNTTLKRCSLLLKSSKS